MKNIAIIPARSGSKGLKDKNIKLLNGKPLLAYTIESAQKANLFDEIVVSTDSAEYAEIAQEWGANVPFLRDKELASDNASSWEVVRNTILNYQQKGEYFDTVALLQPTSPFRSSESIIEGYNIYHEKNATAVVSVCEVDHSPLWSNVLPKDSSLSNFLSIDLLNSPRQNLPTYYRLNGALYIIDRKHILSTDNIYDENSYALIMSKENSVDIDDALDFQFAESIIKFYT